MKISIINDHFSSGLGGQHRIQNLSVGFNRLGHAVTYISPQGISDKVSCLYVERSTFNHQSYSLMNAYFNDFFKIFKRLQSNQCKPDLLLIELPNTMLKALNGLSPNSVNVAYDFAGLWTSTLDKSKTYQPIGKALSSFRLISQLFEDSISIISSKLPDVITVPTTPMKGLVERFS